MKLTEEIGSYIVAPDDIDSVEITIPQGLLRKAIMRINELEHRLKSADDALGLIGYDQESGKFCGY